MVISPENIIGNTYQFNIIPKQRLLAIIHFYSRLYRFRRQILKPCFGMIFNRDITIFLITATFSNLVQIGVFSVTSDVMFCLNTDLKKKNVAMVYFLLNMSHRKSYYSIIKYENYYLWDIAIRYGYNIKEKQKIQHSNLLFWISIQAKRHIWRSRLRASIGLCPKIWVTISLTD